jgi:hypothetical protein
VVRESLDFCDVSVEAAAWGASDGVFTIHPTRNIAITKDLTLPLQGRYLFHEQFVTAAVALAAAPSAQ